MNGGAAGSNSVAVSWHAIVLTLDKLSWRKKKDKAVSVYTSTFGLPGLLQNAAD